MTDLQSPQIGLRRASSNKFQSDRLPIVNDGRSIDGTNLVAKTPFKQGNHSPADWELAAQSIPCGSACLSKYNDMARNAQYKRTVSGGSLQ